MVPEYYSNYVKEVENERLGIINPTVTLPQSSNLYKGLSVRIFCNYYIHTYVKIVFTFIFCIKKNQLFNCEFFKKKNKVQTT